MWKPVTSPKVPADEDDADEDDDLLVAGAEFQIGDPDQELADALHVDLEWLARCVDLLRDRPQLIFYGPPGTGKTYIAKALARYLAGEDNVKIVQFHPAYSYEDFFEGFRPVPQGHGQVAFELKPGPMRQLTDRGVRRRADLRNVNGRSDKQSHSPGARRLRWVGDDCGGPSAIVTDPVPLGLLLVFFIVATELLVARNYALATVFLTPMTSGMVYLGHPQPLGPLLADRAVDTCIGVAMAFIAVIATHAVRHP